MRGRRRAPEAPPDNSQPRGRGGAGLGRGPAFPGTQRRAGTFAGSLRVSRESAGPAWQPRRAPGLSRGRGGPGVGGDGVRPGLSKVGAAGRARGGRRREGAPRAGPLARRPRPPALSSRPSPAGRHLRALTGTRARHWGSPLPWQRRRLGPRSHGHPRLCAQPLWRLSAHPGLPNLGVRGRNPGPGGKS